MVIISVDHDTTDIDVINTVEYFTDGDTTICNGGYINRQCQFTTVIGVINTVEYLQMEIQRYIMVVISIDNVALLQTSAL